MKIWIKYDFRSLERERKEKTGGERQREIVDFYKTYPNLKPQSFYNSELNPMQIQRLNSFPFLSATILQQALCPCQTPPSLPFDIITGWSHSFLVFRNQKVQSVLSKSKCFSHEISGLWEGERHSLFLHFLSPLPHPRPHHVPTTPHHPTSHPPDPPLGRGKREGAGRWANLFLFG